MLLEIQSQTVNANGIKEIVLNRLLEDKIINEEVAAEYAEKWQVIVIKKSWFLQWMEKFSNDGTKDDYLYKFVRFED
jgi:hypothetical protein